MATDPGMLTSWYQDYMKSSPSTAAAQTTNASATAWKPDADSTVAGQFNKITAAGSPLIDQATTKAKQDSASRGLLNSSLGVTAGLDAAYKAALPIAQQDANTFAGAGQFNANAANTTSQFNANAANSTSQFNAGATNSAVTQQRGAGIESEMSAQQRAEAAAGREFTTSERLGTQGFQAGESALGRQQQTMLQSTDIGAQLDRQMRDIKAQAESQGRQLSFQEQQQLRDLASQKEMQSAGFTQQTALQQGDFAQQSKTQAADLASRYDLANMDVQSRAALQQADAANQQKLQQANAALQTGLQASDNAVKQSMQSYDAALKQSMQGVDNASRLQLATLDADNRVALANLEAKYKNELQANSSMASSYQSMVDSFTRVMVSPDMDAEAKQAAINNLTTLYDNTLKMQADVSGLKLGQLLMPDDQAGPPKPLVPTLEPVATPKAETGKFAGMLSDFADNQGGQNGGP